MIRIRSVAALGGAFVAALAVALLAATAFAGSAAGGARQHRSYAFGVGTHGPGCAQDVPPPRVPFCYAVSLTYRLLAVQRGQGHAWGVFSRFNHGNGFTPRERSRA